jgi:CheY-like chemotaxis protein
VHNGEKAVNECLSSNFDLIIMDIKMPNLDGIEATKKIRFKNQNIPIIAQTAFFLKNERDTCIDAGCNDYIPKPVNSRKLLETINKYFINGS